MFVTAVSHRLMNTEATEPTNGSSPATRPAVLDLLLDRGVVRRAGLDRVVEDRRVGSQPRHRELPDVARERAVSKDVAGNVVEPETLSLVVEGFGGFHVSELLWLAASCRSRGPSLGTRCS